MCIGRASPHAGVEEADSIMTSRQLRKKKPFATPGIGRRTPNDPRRRTTPEPRRRPPDPRDVLQGRAPLGERFFFFSEGKVRYTYEDMQRQTSVGQTQSTRIALARQQGI